MTKVDKIALKFETIMTHLETANILIQELPVEFVSQAECYDLFNDIEGIIDRIQDISDETCVPLIIEQQEREEEIRVLERRLAELRSMN